MPRTFRTVDRNTHNGFDSIRHLGISIAIVLTLSGCSSLGLSALNATSRLESGHSVEKDIAYGEAEWQRLNVHIPKGVDLSDQNSNRLPVVIFFYGGGWNSGSKDQYYFAASAFTDKGYLVVIPDYVKYPKGKFPTFIEDGALAVAWIKENIARYGGDPDTLLAVGHSAGAHLGALLISDAQYLKNVGLEPKTITAFAGLAGPYNFTPKRKPYTLIFGPEENFPKMKIMNFIDGDEPPMLLLHGTDDETVGIINKNSLVDAIKKNGGVYKGIAYPGVSHVGILLSLHPTFIGDTNAAEDIDQFFRQHLNNHRSVAADGATSE